MVSPSLLADHNVPFHPDADSIVEISSTNFHDEVTMEIDDTPPSPSTVLATPKTTTK
jgi:hypothetical protein